MQNSPCYSIKRISGAHIFIGQSMTLFLRPLGPHRSYNKARQKNRRTPTLSFLSQRPVTTLSQLDANRLVITPHCRTTIYILPPNNGRRISVCCRRRPQSKRLRRERVTWNARSFTIFNAQRLFTSDHVTYAFVYVWRY